MVGGLEFAPIVKDLSLGLGFWQLCDVGREGIDFFEGFLLHFVACPCREVAFGVRPGDGFGHGDFGDFWQDFGGFVDAEEVVAGVGTPSLDKFIEKLENAAVCPLVFAKGLKIHE